MIINSNKKKYIILISLFGILIDQFTKYAVFKMNVDLATISLLTKTTPAKNTGAAFSILSNSTTFLTYTSIFISFILILFILINKEGSCLHSLGISLLLAGTVGNALDRILLGYVRDFIELIPINFPIFNIADIMINISILLLLIDSQNRDKKRFSKKINDNSLY